MIWGGLADEKEIVKKGSFGWNDFYGGVEF